MNGKQIRRKTKVVSFSFDPEVILILDKLRQKTGQTRSAYVASLIENYSVKKEWEQIKEWGEETARKFKVTSEEDVYKLLGDA